MKKNPINAARAALLAAVLLPLPACRSLVREERLGCPSQLQFHVLNPEAVPPRDEVWVAACPLDGQEPLSTGSSPLPDLADGSFRLPVPKLPEVAVYGGLGFRNAHRQGSSWVVDEGMDADPLFRFSSCLPTLEETATVPVEFTKEYCRITVWIVPPEGSDGGCPVTLTARSNTCGTDLANGNPVQGAYRFTPSERADGLFTFTVPRQCDHALALELHPKEGYPDIPPGMEDILLWPWLNQAGTFSWELKNLPDADIELDPWQSVVQVSLSDWLNGSEIEFKF